jgi:molecular chaperone GrpE
MAEEVKETIEKNEEETEQETTTEASEEEVALVDDEETINVDNVTNDDAKKIEELETKLKESEEKYLRTHADFENIKKRLEREKYQAIDYASEKFAKDLLAVIDSLGMAIDAVDNNTEASAEDLLTNLKEGVDLTLKQFLSMMEKNNVSMIETDGELDPNVHEAVMRVDSDDVESGHIVQVMQKGYKLKDRVLRAAMVSVAN